MSSSLIVPIVELNNVRPHPNADKLELVDVLGYQMVVPKDMYKSGDIAVYFPSDTLIPDKWAEEFGVKSYLHGKDKDRVGQVRLRGEPSFGIIARIPEGLDCKVGDNVSDFFGCQKYIPPIKTSCGDAAPYDENIDPYIQRYTDIENGRIYTNIFEDEEKVIATEKIHGTNCKIGMVKDVNIFAGSMSVRRKRPVNKDGCPAFFWDNEMKNNVYWYPWTIKAVQNLINELIENHKVVIVYGEVFGGSIQSLNYGIPKGQGLGFKAFDIMVDGKYLDYDYFKSLCDHFNVPTVPVLYRGPYSMEKMKELADGNSTIAEHIREGIVVKPETERIDPKIGRAILKYIGTEYSLSKHKELDNTDN